jgi:hypothetical protein
MSKSHDHDYSPAGQQDTTTAQLVYLGNWYKYYHLGDPQDLQEYYLTSVSYDCDLLTSTNHRWHIILIVHITARMCREHPVPCLKAERGPRVPEQLCV